MKLIFFLHVFTCGSKSQIDHYRHLLRQWIRDVNPLSPEQCCKMYDNYRIYTIILTSVRCTINNGKNPIMYDNFRVFSRSSKHTSYRFSLFSDPESFRRLSCLHASTYTHTYTRTHTHRHHTVSPATRCLHVNTTVLPKKTVQFRQRQLSV